MAYPARKWLLFCRVMFCYITKILQETEVLSQVEDYLLKCITLCKMITSKFKFNPDII